MVKLYSQYYFKFRELKLHSNSFSESHRKTIALNRLKDKLQTRNVFVQIKVVVKWNESTTLNGLK